MAHTGKSKQRRLVGTPEARKRACPVWGGLGGNRPVKARRPRSTPYRPGAPLQPAHSPFPKPSSQGTAEALPSPILRRLSSPSESRAAPRPWARGKSRGRSVAAGGALGELEDVLPRCCAKGRCKRPFKIPARFRSQLTVSADLWR
jgi:hypothetical protein